MLDNALNSSGTLVIVILKVACQRINSKPKVARLAENYDLQQLKAHKSNI